MSGVSEMAARLRKGESVTGSALPQDATLGFIGRIRTPWASREECPRQGRHDGPDCHIEVFEPWVPALAGIDAYETIEILYWLDRARRDLLVQNPKNDGETFRGTFALRSPQRPNPIGTSLVRLVAVEGPVLVVRGLDCLDGTPLLDIKPDRCGYSPTAEAK